jgi:hypothetical protein
MDHDRNLVETALRVLTAITGDEEPAYCDLLRIQREFPDARLPVDDLCSQIIRPWANRYLNSNAE